MDGPGRRPRVLIVNPNSSAHVSAGLSRQAGFLCGATAGWTVTTTKRAPPYIGSLEDIADATPFVVATALDVVNRSRQPYDSVVIGSFAELAVAEVQEATGLPTCSLLSSALEIAARDHARVGIVTGGEQWRELLPPMVARLGYGPRLAGIDCLPVDGTTIARDPATAAAQLLEAIARCVQACSPSLVIIGGAGLAGLSSMVASSSPIPLLDSFEASIRLSLDRTAQFQAV